MSLNRIIPLLLLEENKLVKTKKFSEPKYVGDPKNTIKLFNEMNCSEIMIIDIEKTKKNKSIEFNFIESIISEAFMPVSYGGGIKSLNDINELIKIGCEKVSINYRSDDFEFIEKAVSTFGSSTIIVSIDIKKLEDDIFCYDYISKQTKKEKLNDKIKQLNKRGVGEYLINFVDKDGLMSGFDRETIEEILKLTNSQVTFCGGASSYDDLYRTILTGAKSLAAGSLFIYQSLDSGVLINYPDGDEYTKILEA